MRPAAGQPTGGAEAVDTAVHTVPGARLPVQGCQLSPDQLPENEEGGHAHKGLQAEDKWRLSHLQATHCAVLLPCQTLPGNEVSCALLFQHQAQTQAATVAAEVIHFSSTYLYQMNKRNYSSFRINFYV